MSVPSDKLPGMLSVGLQTLRTFTQTGTNVRDNAPKPGLDAKLSMGLQFTESATALPGLLSKGFAKVNMAASVVQGSQDLYQGIQQKDTSRTGSGMVTIGLVAVGVISGPVALATGTAYGVVSFVAPDKAKAMHEQIGRATHQAFDMAKTEFARQSSNFTNKP